MGIFQNSAFVSSTSRTNEVIVNGRMPNNFEMASSSASATTTTTTTSNINNFNNNNNKKNVPPSTNSATPGEGKIIICGQILKI